MARPIATTGQPGAPIATGGKPQKPSKPVRTIQVKAHTRRVAPSPLKQAGLSSGQIAYWQNKLPGASAKTILRARARQQFNHNPQAFGPNTDLSPMQANQQSQAAANLKYGPTLTADQNQVNNLPGWFQAYQNSVAQLQQQAAANAQAAVTGINTSGQQVGQMQQGLQQSALQAMGQDAASRGAQVDPNLAASASQFQAGLAALNASDASRAQAVGNSENAYLGNLGAIQQAAGQQAQTRAQQQLNLDRQARADYQTTQRANIISNAQKQGDVLSTLNLNNTKANQTFKTNQAKLQLAGQIAGSNAANQRGNRRLNQAKFNEKQSNDQALLKLKQRAANLAGSKNFLAQQQFSAKYGITPQHFSQLSDKQKSSYLKKHGIKLGSGGGLSSQKGGPSAGELSTSRKVSTDIENAIVTAHHYLNAAPGAKQNDIFSNMTAPKTSPTKTNPNGNIYGGHDSLVTRAALEIVFNPNHRLSQKTAQALRSAGLIVPNRWKPLGNPKPGAGALAEPNT